MAFQPVAHRQLGVSEPGVASTTDDAFTSAITLCCSCSASASVLSRVTVTDSHSPPGRLNSTSSFTAPARMALTVPTH